MCNIESGYFIVNGIAPADKIYRALVNDKINLECWVSFDDNEKGKEFKAELKVVLPSGKEFSFYTPLMKVQNGQIFTSAEFENPLPIGTYSTAWFVIYDINGKTVCDGHGKGLNCDTLIISRTREK